MQANEESESFLSIFGEHCQSAGEIASCNSLKDSLQDTSSIKVKLRVLYVESVLTAALSARVIEKQKSAIRKILAELAGSHMGVGETLVQNKLMEASKGKLD